MNPWTDAGLSNAARAGAMLALGRPVPRSAPPESGRGRYRVEPPVHLAAARSRAPHTAPETGFALLEPKRTRWELPAPVSANRLLEGVGAGRGPLPPVMNPGYSRPDERSAPMAVSTDGYLADGYLADGYGSGGYPPSADLGGWWADSTPLTPVPVVVSAPSMPDSPGSTALGSTVLESTVLGALGSTAGVLEPAPRRLDHDLVPGPGAVEATSTDRAALDSLDSSGLFGALSQSPR